MIWDLGFEDEEDEAVGEVVDWAGSGLVVDMVLLGEENGLLGYAKKSTLLIVELMCRYEVAARNWSHGGGFRALKIESCQCGVKLLI